MYAEIDGVLLLKKSTAIVEKNRVESPLVRIKQSDIADFHNSLGLTAEGIFTAPKADIPAALNLGSDELRGLYARLNKKGGHLVTAATADVDELHNLVFGLNYQCHGHVDHNLNRLKHIKGKLGANTQYVLCDAEVMPFKEHAVDGYFTFNGVEGSAKEVQKEIYASLKAVLNPEASCVFLVDEGEKNYLESFYKSDLLSAKLKPWKKNSLPKIYFQKTQHASGGAPSSISGKRSFGSQFSKA
ncbi:MAG: hypothetical protein Roseis2KO_07910 [Roseivirga sp.]